MLIRLQRIRKSLWLIVPYGLVNRKIRYNIKNYSIPEQLSMDNVLARKSNSIWFSISSKSLCPYIIIIYRWPEIAPQYGMSYMKRGWNATYVLQREWICLRAHIICGCVGCIIHVDLIPLEPFFFSIWSDLLNKESRHPK